MLKIVDHPVAGNYLKVLRDRETQIEGFRQALRKLGLILAVEATCDLEAVAGTVTTPLGVEAAAGRSGTAGSCWRPYCGQDWALWTAFWICCPRPRWGI